MDNIPCQRWDTSYPHVHKYTHSDYYPDESVEEAGNFCRSTSGAQIPWCYTTGSKRWQYCDIEQCPYKYCYDTNLSELYAGTVTKTQSGIKCQNWDSQYPHKHKYGKPERFPEGDVSKAKNYCREPSGHGKPWCYTTDHSKRWELCCINNCSDLE
ncbi:plasminogen-like [Ruditapes philippinarum]|uniref:plasminogen-like n=1 Tax=Ruditapes philippinarum TaxID=129788 RepID=UPI00295C1353|nr:plasminogen-like [Ruditapes philippinarum]